MRRPSATNSCGSGNTLPIAIFGASAHPPQAPIWLDPSGCPPGRVFHFGDVHAGLAIPRVAPHASLGRGEGAMTSGENRFRPNRHRIPAYCLSMISAQTLRVRESMIRKSMPQNTPWGYDPMGGYRFSLSQQTRNAFARKSCSNNNLVVQI